MNSNNGWLFNIWLVLLFMFVAMPNACSQKENTVRIVEAINNIDCSCQIKKE